MIIRKNPEKKRNPEPGKSPEKLAKSGRSGNTD